MSWEALPNGVFSEIRGPSDHFSKNVLVRQFDALKWLGLGVTKTVLLLENIPCFDHILPTSFSHLAKLEALLSDWGSPDNIYNIFPNVPTYYNVLLNVLKVRERGNIKVKCKITKMLLDIVTFSWRIILNKLKRRSEWGQSNLVLRIDWWNQIAINGCQNGTYKWN